MAEHIKWQKTANKKYFGSWDLPDDGKDMIVTIEDVKREMEELAHEMDYLELGATENYERLLSECLIFPSFK